MNITIWQSFSSNHSAAFTIVAEFPNEEEAFKQYMIVRRALGRLISWYELPSNKISRYDAVGGDGKIPPFDIEMEIWGQFGIQPNGANDWIPQLSRENLQFAFKQFENFIFVENYGMTYAAAEPLDRVLEKVGGKVYRIGESYTEWFDCVIECDAPSESIAADIEKELLQSKIWDHKNIKPRPWLPYFSGRKAPEMELLLEIEKEHIQYWKWVSKLQHLSQEYKSETNQVQRQRKLQEYNEFKKQQPDFTRAESVKIPFPRYQEIQCYGMVTRSEKHIRIDTDFGFSGLLVNVPAMVAWMRDLECEVKIEFTEKEL